MPKLVFALEIRRADPGAKLLIYLPPQFASPDTHSILTSLGLELTFQAGACIRPLLSSTHYAVLVGGATGDGARRGLVTIV